MVVPKRLPGQPEGITNGGNVDETHWTEGPFRKVLFDKESTPSPQHGCIIGIKGQMMIVKGKHPNDHGGQPCCQTPIHTPGGVGFPFLWEYKFNGDSGEPVKETLEEEDLGCQEFESMMLQRHGKSR